MFFANYEPGGSGSGVGSEVGYTEPLREYLNRFLKEHKIRSVVDYACGDQQWAKVCRLGRPRLSRARHRPQVDSIDCGRSSRAAGLSWSAKRSPKLI